MLGCLLARPARQLNRNPPCPAPIRAQAPGGPGGVARTKSVNSYKAFQPLPEAKQAQLAEALSNDEVLTEKMEGVVDILQKAGELGASEDGEVELDLTWVPLPPPPFVPLLRALAAGPCWARWARWTLRASCQPLPVRLPLRRTHTCWGSAAQVAALPGCQKWPWFAIPGLLPWSFLAAYRQAQRLHCLPACQHHWVPAACLQRLRCAVLHWDCSRDSVWRDWMACL
jgi:hypothetical protein